MYNKYERLIINLLTTSKLFSLSFLQLKEFLKIILENEALELTGETPSENEVEGFYLTAEATLNGLIRKHIIKLENGNLSIYASNIKHDVKLEKAFWVFLKILPKATSPLACFIPKYPSDLMVTAHAKDGGTMLYEIIIIESGNERLLTPLSLPDREVDEDSYPTYIIVVDNTREAPQKCLPIIKNREFIFAEITGMESTDTQVTLFKV